MDRRAGAGDDDESGRLSRFRKRFEGVAQEVQVAPEQSTTWDQQDLDWMSGGREAQAGVPIARGKMAKGKGKK